MKAVQARPHSKKHEQVNFLKKEMVYNNTDIWFSLSYHHVQGGFLTNLIDVRGGGPFNNASTTQSGAFNPQIIPNQWNQFLNDSAPLFNNNANNNNNNNNNRFSFGGWSTVALVS